MKEIEPIRLFPSSWKLFIVSLFFVAVSAISIVVTVRTIANLNLQGAVYWFGALVLPPMTVFFLFRLLRPRPILVIDQRGITADWGMASVGFIGWDEIAGFQRVGFMYQEFIVVRLKDPEAVIARLPKWKRRMRNSDMKHLGSPFSIPELLLPISVNELHAKLLSIWQIKQSESEHNGN